MPRVIQTDSVAGSKASCVQWKDEPIHQRFDRVFAWTRISRQPDEKALFPRSRYDTLRKATYPSMTNPRR